MAPPNLSYEFGPSSNPRPVSGPDLWRIAVDSNLRIEVSFEQEIYELWTHP